MIFPLPSMFGLSFVVTPFWERIAEPAQELPAAPAADDVSDHVSGCDVERETASPPRQLQFKGYVWHLQTNWLPSADAGWDHFVDNDPVDIHERSIARERERLRLQDAHQAQGKLRPTP